MKNWIRNKLFTPLLKLLKQGVSPKKLAWSVAVGFLLGVSPLFGITTLLGVAIGLLFRLNIAAIQLVNYIAYPLQLLLLVPYFQFGAFLFGIQNIISSLDQLQQLFQADFMLALQNVGWLFVGAVLAWLFFTFPLGIVVYKLCFHIFRKKFEII